MTGKKCMYLMLVMLVAAGVTLTGCAGGKKKSAEEPAAVREQAPAAETAPAETAPEDAPKTGGNHSIMELCDKLIAEMKATGTPDTALQQTRGGCEQGAKAYEGNSEALDEFVGFIMDSCKDKTGVEWFNCYNEKAREAGMKAAAKMSAPAPAK